MNIVLSGFMGTGKTTVGKRLARELNLKFVDADELIEEKAGMPVKEIFARYGEHYFRGIEKEVVKMVTSTMTKTVFATGGGAVKDGENRKVLKAWGMLICLKASVEQILKRVGEGDERPLLDREGGKTAIEKLLKERERAYGDSNFIVDTTDKTKEQVVSEIKAFIHDGHK